MREACQVAEIVLKYSLEVSITFIWDCSLKVKRIAHNNRSVSPSLTGPTIL